MDPTWPTTKWDEFLTSWNPLHVTTCHTPLTATNNFQLQFLSHHFQPLVRITVLKHHQQYIFVEGIKQTFGWISTPAYSLNFLPDRFKSLKNLASKQILTMMWIRHGLQLSTMDLNFWMCYHNMPHKLTPTPLTATKSRNHLSLSLHFPSLKTNPQWHPDSRRQKIQPHLRLPTPESYY